MEPLNSGGIFGRPLKYSRMAAGVSRIIGETVPEVSLDLRSL
jgi:hypothetical protein